MDDKNEFIELFAADCMYCKPGSNNSRWHAKGIRCVRCLNQLQADVDKNGKWAIQKIERDRILWKKYYGQEDGGRRGGCNLAKVILSETERPERAALWILLIAPKGMIGSETWHDLKRVVGINAVREAKLKLAIWTEGRRCALESVDHAPYVAKATNHVLSEMHTHIGRSKEHIIERRYDVKPVDDLWDGVIIDMINFWAFQGRVNMEGL